MTNHPGAKVKALRERHGLSQYDLARAIGTSQSAIGNLEAQRNSLSLKNAKKIAGLFGVKWTALLDTEEALPCQN